MSVIKKAYKMASDFVAYNLNTYRKMNDPGLLKLNEEDRNSEEGELYILFTGASLKGKDLRWLNGRNVMATNSAFLHEMYDQFDVKHYSLIEPWNYRLHFFLGYMLDMAILRRKGSVKTKFWLSASAKNYIDTPSIHHDFNTSELLSSVDIRYVAGSGDFLTDDVIRYDMSKPSNVAKGTPAFAIFLAIYLGYTKIYLLGSDYQKTPMVLGHFYDNVRKILSEAEMNDIAGYDVVAQSDARFNKIHSYAMSNGVEIFNVVDEGFVSRCLPSVKYDDIAEGGIRR